MPGLAVPVRRRHESVDVSEENDDGSSSAGDATPSSHGSNKRAKLQRAPADVDDSWALSPPPTSQRPTQGARSNAPANAHRDSGVALDDSPLPVRMEHKPGSIVRIALRNFVTYTEASFLPGPTLNMVIGPNGTGKSTLVCAICLGLGWSTEHLGRAKAISEFVKNGCEEAAIEIELKGRPGRRNPVFKRVIRREGNKSTWTLNGQTSNLKSIRSVAEGFAIQIDNLCQFLPQDRVVEFSAMSPKELLASTIRAAAAPEVTEWHEQLKTLRADQKKSENERNTCQTDLANLEKRQNMQRADVERMRERVDLVKKIELMAKCRGFLEYSDTKERLREARENQRTAKNELAVLNAELQPITNAIDAKKEYKDRIESVVNGRKRMFTGLETQLKEYENQQQQNEDSMKTSDASKENVLKKNQERKREVARLQNDVRMIKKQMEEVLPEFDPAAYNERIREKEREVKQVEQKIKDLGSDATAKKNERTSKESQLEQMTKELENLRSEAGQQATLLRNMSRDTAEAWTWIQQNRREFEGEIYGPAVVECSITDPRYADGIESLLQKGDFLSITCTNRSDFKKLQDRIYGEKGLADVTLRTSTTPLDSFRQPVDEETMKSLDLDGWALDYMKGPEPVLAMLCVEKRLHQSAVRLRDSDDAHYERMQRSAVNTWVTSKRRYAINRRKEYGDAGVSTTTRDVPPAKIWTKRGVDVGAERQLRERIDTLKSEIDELRAEEKIIEAKRVEEKKGLQALGAKVADMRQEKDELQRARSAFAALPAKLENKEAKLAELREAEDDSKQELRTISAERTALILAKAQLAIDYGKTTESLREAHANLIAASIAHIEATSDFDTLQRRNEDGQKRKDELGAEVKRLTDAVTKLKEEAKRIAKSVEKLSENNPAVVEFWTSLSDEEKPRTAETFDVELESMSTRLSLLTDGNPRVIREFEDREVKIQSQRSQLAAHDEALAALAEDITTIRSQWEPRLEAVIDRISAAFAASFAKIDCAGEVKIHRAGEGGRDFDDWAAQIHVKFREEEQMSVLDSHRQSGGERAVSTVFYLMALQSLSRAPFRVVDEINQGMDPRNERMVHERMVDIACGAGAGERGADESADGGADAGSQYFLITPKLLTGLKYSPGMTVHCIASGERMPTDPRALDFALLLRRARELGLGHRAPPAAAATAAAG